MVLRRWQLADTAIKIAATKSEARLRGLKNEPLPFDNLRYAMRRLRTAQRVLH